MTEPITTELRGVMSHTTMAGIPLVELGEYEFEMRCDAIDAVHANLERENESLRRELDRTRGEWDYWESTHVELPKDADGEYIRVGEAVTCGATVWTVTGLKFLGEGWGICCTVYNEYGGSGTSVYPPSDLRHYHVPTVEDVLREFADLVRKERVELATISEETIIEYAAKLRLAGDAA